MHFKNEIKIMNKNKDKNQSNTSHTKKLEEVIRQKQTESEALKKLMVSLENTEKKKTKNK